MIRDRYWSRFLTLGPKHSLTFPARKEYVTENLLFMVADAMTKRTRISPFVYLQLNQRSSANQNLMDHLRSGGKRY